MSGYEEAFKSEATPEPAAAATPAVEESAPAPESADPTPAPSAEPHQPPAQATPAVVGEPSPAPVPISALLDERERRQAEKARADALQARLDAIERAKNEVAEQAPNILDDPEGYHAFMMAQIERLQKGFDGRLQNTVTQERMAISEDRWRDKLGDENWNKLNAWVQTWPAQAHRQAMAQRDPYGWAWSKFQEIERGKRVKTIEEKLSGKDLDAYIAEQVAAKLAEAQAQPAQPGAPAQPDRERNPDGTFKPSSQPQQRHQPPSLATVNGAPAPRGSEVRSGYDAAFRK